MSESQRKRPQVIALSSNSDEVAANVETPYSSVSPFLYV